MKIEWKESYLLHIKVIDEQHKELIEMGSRLLEMVMDVSSPEVTKNMKHLVEDLNAYTIYHFEQEENLLQQYSYSEMKEHKARHQEFILKIAQFEKDIEFSIDWELLIQMLEFLISWIAEHIMVEDQKYRNEFKKQNIEGLFE